MRRHGWEVERARRVVKGAPIMRDLKRHNMMSGRVSAARYESYKAYEAVKELQIRFFVGRLVV